MNSEKVVNMIPKMKVGKGLITIVIVVLILIFVLINSFVIVNAGHRGVVVQLGAVRSVVLNEGIHLIIPFIQKVIQADVRVQKSQSEQTAASKDLQNVSTTVAVNFHVEPSTANKLYQNVGLAYVERIVDPFIGEAVKAVTAQYTAEELISKRSEVSSKIKENLSSKLSNYYMVLDEINITEFKFSQEFNNAIEQKQVAEQQALKANLDLQRIEIEAKQKIESAKAEAEALRLQKQEVSADLLKLREIEAQIKAIEKWDGKMPNVTGGAVPFINVD
jgi:regulator of protease activity HflC (stomatin/prohibitin superfamily)